MSYKLAPINFERLSDQYFVANTVGEYIFLPRDVFLKYIEKTLKSKDSSFLNLKAKHMLVDSSADDVVNMLAVKYRTKKSFLSNFTSLHMIVPTLSCNSNCVYCQVSSKDVDERKFYMDKTTAKKAVETIFKSPSDYIKIEFQGGEPLLNFEIVKYIVKYSEKLNLFFKKNLQFVICTNLTLINENILRFFKQHKIFISTSLDGPRELHNYNRPLRGVNNSYDILVEKLKLARKVLGQQGISALMTATRCSLRQLPAVVDEYVLQGFGSIFIRMINPYGMAEKQQMDLSYSAEDFCEAYREALKYIIKLNLKGTYIVEEFATLLLRRILTPFATGFVDFQSPAGIGISGVIYDYDGSVYVSDEGRMLAAMGDKKFLMGNVHSSTYEDLFCGDFLKSLLNISCLECLPVCSTCAYQPFCGADPVRNYVEQKDLIGNKMNSKICYKNKRIIQHILDIIKEGDDDVMDVFWSWITSRSLEEIQLKDKGLNEKSLR